MDDEVKQYREELLAEIGSGSAVGGGYSSTLFIDRACSVLESAEEFTEYNVCRVTGENRAGRSVQLDAHSFSAADGVLNLVIAVFSGAEEPDALLTDDVRLPVAAAHRFLEGSVHGALEGAWDESHDAHAVCKEIFSIATGGELTKVRIYLLSDRPVSRALGKMPELSLGPTKVETHIWDIGRMARVEASLRGREDIVIDFLSEYGQGIPALPAGLGGSAHYDSYMCVMPGGILASLYDRFGGRILEQNVRAFLGDNRKVNKGIRETLKFAPEMFFAFNNGLTVTVANLEIVSNQAGYPEISTVKGLQIVNGGQTTASLYWARKAGIDLDAVRVQMKLSKLPEEGFEDAVHNIARFANAQNAVSASDLFAGHPYFQRLEGISRQVLAPPAKTGDSPSYWYFERTTGSYKVEMRRRSGLAAKTWQMLHPKRQLLTKTDVARYDTTFDGRPHLVSSGAQKNIAAFGKIVTEAWAEDPTVFDLNYFQQLVGRAILIRAVDSAIPDQDWYPGSILRPLTTYTVALMGSRMRSKSLKPDYNAIWKIPRAPDEFISEAMRIAKRLLPMLQDIPEEQVRNRLITEWVKREACWERIEDSEIELSDRFLRTLVTDPKPVRRREDWPTKAALLWRGGEWSRLRDWNREAGLLTEGEAELVEWAAIAGAFRPNRHKLSKLKEAWSRAVNHGFV